LCLRIPLFSGSAEPFRCYGIVLRRSFAVLISPAHFELGLGIAAFGMLD
jgi:hypothetical protein